MVIYGEISTDLVFDRNVDCLLFNKSLLLY